MGFIYVEGRAQGPDGREVTVNFLVDIGSGYTMLPYLVWQSLGLEPTREGKFALADGTVVTRNMSRRFLVLPQGAEYSPVILGESGDDHALLGVVTLSIMGLMLNPFRRAICWRRLLWRG